MREFTDQDGITWTTSIEGQDGPDYKGRFHLVFASSNGRAELRDVRWNSERTARRTLETMSSVELRRRLRSATGRLSLPVG
jgi:hypothetical protein